MKTIKFPNINNFEVRTDSKTKSDIYTKAMIFPPHIHDTLEIYIHESGDASFMVENNFYKLSVGDAIICKPNEIHNCVLHSDTIHKYTCLWINADCEFLINPLLEHNFGENNLISPNENDKEQLLNTLELVKNVSDCSSIEYFSNIVAILSILEKNLSVTSNQSLLPENFKTILTDINQNFSTINSIDEICQKYFLSRSTLCRLFKKHLHTSPMLYLESKRLSHSRILLKDGKSVYDACFLSGFSDYSNYIRLFKSRFGTTPKRYKDGN